MRPTPPCYKCEKRVLGCHSTCENYKYFINENEKYKQLVREEREFVDFDITMKERLLK